MKVTEGTSFELPDGSWCKPEIELDDTDFELVAVEWGLTQDQVQGMKPLTKYKILSTVARQMLAVRHVQAMSSNQGWVQTEGRALLESVTGELQTLHAMVVRGS